MIYVILNIVSVLFIHQRMVVRGNHLERLVGMIVVGVAPDEEKHSPPKGGRWGQPPSRYDTSTTQRQQQEQ
jgi:hypothetical protein